MNKGSLVNLPKTYCLRIFPQSPFTFLTFNVQYHVKTFPLSLFACAAFNFQYRFKTFPRFPFTCSAFKFHRKPLKHKLFIRRPSMKKYRQSHLYKVLQKTFPSVSEDIRKVALSGGSRGISGFLDVT